MLRWQKHLGDTKTTVYTGSGSFGLHLDANEIQWNKIET